MTPLPPLSWSALFGTWQLRPGWLVVGALALAAYAAGLALAHRRGRRSVPALRALSFAAGVVIAVGVISSGIDTYGTIIFWVHMIEHLVLIMLVPALLVVGHPLTVWRAAARDQARVDRVLQSGAMSVLLNPIFGFVVFAAAIVGTHLTGFMNAMAMHPGLATFEQVLYLVAGCVYLLPLLGFEPVRRSTPKLFRVFLFLLGMAPDTIVGIVLLQSDHDKYTAMSAIKPAWAPTGLADQNIGGALMWVGGDGLMMVFAVAVTIAMISDPHKDETLGAWLEGVRRNTLREHTGATDTELARDSRVDEDDDAWSAYNRMLAGLREREDG